MLRLFIVRHGQTSWNLSGRNQGRADIELDETGLAQAEEFANSFREEKIDLVYSSDAKRAAATAAALAKLLGIEVETDHRLRERDYGTWEGKTRAEIEAEDGKAYAEYKTDPATKRTGGAESGIEVFARAGYFLSDLLKQHEDGNYVIVTHGGTGSALIAALLHGSPATANCFRLSNCGITEFTIEKNGRRRLLRFNDCGHLSCAPLRYGGITHA